MVDDGLEVLDDDECIQLLSEESVGHVGLSVGALPAIFPVTYVLDGQDILFRAGEGLKLSAALDRNVVAFEVDHEDAEHCRGWSVLVIGVAAKVGDANAPLPAVLPTPWAGGRRDHVVRITPELISGRRIVGENGRATVAG